MSCLALELLLPYMSVHEILNVRRTCKYFAEKLHPEGHFWLAHAIDTICLHENYDFESKVWASLAEYLHHEKALVRALHFDDTYGDDGVPCPFKNCPCNRKENWESEYLTDAIGNGACFVPVCDANECPGYAKLLTKFVIPVMRMRCGLEAQKRNQSLEDPCIAWRIERYVQSKAAQFESEDEIGLRVVPFDPACIFDE